MRFVKTKGKERKVETVETVETVENYKYTRLPTLEELKKVHGNDPNIPASYWDTMKIGK